jgi:hypothetical protein
MFVAIRAGRIVAIVAYSSQLVLKRLGIAFFAGGVSGWRPAVAVLGNNDISVGFTA